MPRVVPSQVVEFIKNVYTDADLNANQLGRNNAGELRGIVDLIDKIPEELLTMKTEHYAVLICCKAHIREKLASWSADPKSRDTLDQIRGQNPVRLIRAALTKCPDEAPAPATSELIFINDQDFRTNLRNDIGAVTRALSNGEWKAATVLAGSAAEALLLWTLQSRPPASIAAAITALISNGLLTRQPNANLERWDLHEFTEVAAHLAIIESDTATEVRLAREFRNLIHPGRAQRLGQKCDRGTALSSVAALDHIVRDLTP
jgi:hypothetical protein